MQLIPHIYAHNGSNALTRDIGDAPITIICGRIILSISFFPVRRRLKTTGLLSTAGVSGISYGISKVALGHARQWQKIVAATEIPIAPKYIIAILL